MRTLLLLSTISLFLVLSSCGGAGAQSVASPDEMNTFLEANPELSDLDKACVLNGEVKEGMSATTLIFLLGEPSNISTVSQPWGDKLVYSYKKGGKKTFDLERIPNTENEWGVVGIELDN